MVAWRCRPNPGPAWQQGIDFEEIGQTEAVGSGAGRLAVGAGNADELHAGDLGKLLQREQPESAAANHADADLSLLGIHGNSLPAIFFPLDPKWQGVNCRRLHLRKGRGTATGQGGLG